MQSKNLLRQLEFLMEIDRLKSVIRQSPLLDRSRKENSAEHSWHLAMYALVLGDYAAEHINVANVIKMLLIHDVVEVDAGDTPIHGTPDGSQAEREQNAAERIFGLLPDAQAEEFKTLWREFEAEETNDAKFAKALDRFQPLFVNLLTGGGTWSENRVTQEQVINRYGPVIQHGAPELWAIAKTWIAKHFSQPI